MWEIQSLYFQSGYFLSDLDMTSLDNLAFLHFQGETPGNFRFGFFDNLEYFAGLGLHSVYLSQAANLRMLCSYGGSLSSTSLDISGCKSLETIKLASNDLASFNADNFPKLSLLDLSGNPLTSTSLTQLEAWASQGVATSCIPSDRFVRPQNCLLVVLGPSVAQLLFEGE